MHVSSVFLIQFADSTKTPEQTSSLHWDPETLIGHHCLCVISQVQNWKWILPSGKYVGKNTVLGVGGSAQAIGEHAEKCTEHNPRGEGGLL